jgi:hypothetical protein
LSVTFNEFGRQTDGTVRVVSDDAELDADLHEVPLEGRRIRGYRPPVRTERRVADQTTIDRSPPRPPDDIDPRGGGGGGGGGWVVLCSVGDRYEAEIIRGVLEGEGLGPVVIEPVAVPGSWLLPSGHERVPQRVIVMRALLDAAKLALLEAGCSVDDDDEEPERVEVAVPAPRRARSTTIILRWAVLIAVAGAIASYLGQLMRGRGGLPG